MATSNNRVHASQLLYYDLFVPRIYGFFTHIPWCIAHSIQRQLRGCNSIPSLQQTAPTTRSFCEGCIWHDLHILVTAPFCCNRKARVANVQSFTLWQQAIIEITHTQLLYYGLFALRIYGYYQGRP